MNQEKQVRVRFAPSPTGYLHIGNLRASLFNWLFARHIKGKFLVRIEDTDRERSKPEYVDAILNSLRWMGIESDESLVYQSERLPAYQEVLQQLIKTGHAYRCFCTPEEVAARVGRCFSGTGAGECEDIFAGYDGHCRNRSVTAADLQRPFVIRFALPQDKKELFFDDLIRGRVSVALDQFDDFIIARSSCPTELAELEKSPDKRRLNGWPIYNFVVVIDDAFMRITHVIRGEDHITNTFKQLLLYQACGYELPVFAHLPLILGSSGDKLSKRDGATAVPEYQRMGFLPDALFNYLVRLGWAHGDQEVFTRQELIQYFSLDAVGKKGAIFDIQKLTWLNGVYIRQTSEPELFERMTRDVMPTLPDVLKRWDAPRVLQAIALYKERAKTLQELAQELVLLHDGPIEFVAADVAQWTTEKTAEHLARIVQTLESCPDFTLEPIQNGIKEQAKQLEVKLVVLAQPLRIALVGKSTSPGVFELLVLLGKTESVRRVHAFLDFLKKRG